MMHKLCKNCWARMIYDEFDRLWKCVLCGYAEEDPENHQRKISSYVG